MRFLIIITAFAVLFMPKSWALGLGVGLGLSGEEEVQVNPVNGNILLEDGGTILLEDNSGNLIGEDS